MDVLGAHDVRVVRSDGLGTGEMGLTDLSRHRSGWDLIKERLDRLAELKGSRIAQGRRYQIELPGDIFGFGDQVAETGLTVFGVGGIVTGIGVGMEHTGRVIAEQVSGHIAAARGNDMIDGDFFVATVPGVDGYTVANLS